MLCTQYAEARGPAEVRMGEDRLDRAEQSRGAPRAVVIGAGIGGIAAGIRLQAMGYATTIVEAQDQPGGRATVRKVDGYTFDMGPTVITVPHFIEELFSTEPGQPGLDEPDFPAELLREGIRVRSGESGGPNTSRYCKIVPLLPFYRIWFDDGTFFDYDGDPEATRARIAEIEPGDVAGYDAFLADARAIFQRGFLELGYTFFGDLGSMLKVVPDLLKLGAVRSLFGFTSKYFQSPKLRQVFSFETLLVGGNPLRVPAIYAMIHLVESTWGVHYVKGGTGQLIAGLVRKFEELGGTLRLNAPVDQIRVVGADGQPHAGRGRRHARGVILSGGEVVPSDIVVSNGDWAFTEARLIPKQHRSWDSDLRVKTTRYSMSLVVVYFGFKDDPAVPLNLHHHNILLGPRYEGLLTDIFDNLELSPDMSQYLHVPTLTDPSLAPPGHHAAYTLVPVPHNGSGIDWSKEAEPLARRALGLIESKGYIPRLSERLTHLSWISPDHFEGTLRSWLGNAFGPNPA